MYGKINKLWCFTFVRPPTPPLLYIEKFLLTTLLLIYLSKLLPACELNSNSLNRVSRNEKPEFGDSVSCPQRIQQLLEKKSKIKFVLNTNSAYFTLSSAKTEVIIVFIVGYHAKIINLNYDPRKTSLPNNLTRIKLLNFHEKSRKNYNKKYDLC